MMKINFRKQKITELFQNNEITLSNETVSFFVNYYIENYDRVVTNIIEDELVGWEYHNLCAIEQIEPKVKELKICCR